MGSDFSVQSMLLADVFVRFLNEWARWATPEELAKVPEDARPFVKGAWLYAKSTLGVLGVLGVRGLETDGCGFAKNVGFDHSRPGDVEITAFWRKTFVELKFWGRGTLANISQDSLTDLGVFTGVPSWSEFRKSYWFDGVVRRLLGLAENATWTAVAKKGREVRALADSGNQWAETVMRAVSETAASDKRLYVDVLSGWTFVPERAWAFVSGLFRGVHSAKNLSAYVDGFGFHEEISESAVIRPDGTFETHYPSSAEMTYPEFVPGNLWFAIFGDSAKLVTIQFHWKNVAQWIKTPCLNVFDNRFQKCVRTAGEGSYAA